MAGKLSVVTGATGLLGSQIAEQLVGRGERVRALIRPASPAAFLQQLGVELVSGDLGDAESLRRAVTGADIVYHCAAFVGDWGPWKLYQAGIVDATGNLLNACRSAAVRRVLHVSSIVVYGHPHQHGRQITEDEPLGQNLWLRDYYCRAKIRAEELAGEYGAGAVVVRPSWIYGPRDRHVLPRLIEAIRAGRTRLIGSGEQLLNMVHVSDVAEGAIRAANHPSAGGQAYNLCSQGQITQGQLFDTLTETLNLPPVRGRVSLRMALWAGFLSEMIGLAIGLRRSPYVTRHGVSLVGRPTHFCAAKAHTQLAWQPRVSVHDGLRQTLSSLVGQPPLCLRRSLKGQRLHSGTLR